MTDADVRMKENGAEESKEVSPASSTSSSSSSTSSSNATTPSPPSSPSPIAEPSTPAQSTKSPEAEKLKEEGNKLFAEKHFAKATDCYSKAIEVDPSNPIYYSNRAFCHIRLEAYGSAIEDATKAIECDPKFIKAYYRRGAALFALSKLKDARKDFQQVVRIHPRDKDAQSKLTEIDKELRRQAFLKAIESDKGKPASETVDLKAMEVDDSYDGPRLTEEGKVTAAFVSQLTEHFRGQKKLHRRYVYQILLQVLPMLRAMPSMVRVDVPAGTHITVCGDVHGQYYDVLNLFSLNGVPSASNPYLFNGDFVDRGSFSLEVILLFFSYKLLYPQHFHLTRGNHESLNMNSIYGFQGEVNAKVDSGCFELFTEVFNHLPLATLISSKVSGANQPVFVTHGGLFSEDDVTLEQIEKIQRVQQPPETGLMCEILWSDPQRAKGRGPSKRGVGLSFGPDVTANFCKLNGVSMVVRSHEVKEEGYELDHNGQLVTVFSAPNCQNTHQHTDTSPPSPRPHTRSLSNSILTLVRFSVSLNVCADCQWPQKSRREGRSLHYPLLSLVSLSFPPASLPVLFVRRYDGQQGGVHSLRRPPAARLHQVHSRAASPDTAHGVRDTTTRQLPPHQTPSLLHSSYDPSLLFLYSYAGGFMRNSGFT